MVNRQWWEPRKCKNCNTMVTSSECHAINEYINVDLCECDGLCSRCHIEAREESK